MATEVLWSRMLFPLPSFSALWTNEYRVAKVEEEDREREDSERGEELGIVGERNWRRGF